MNVPTAHYNAFNTVTYVLDSIVVMAKHTVIWENFVVKIFSYGKRATKIKLTKIY